MTSYKNTEEILKAVEYQIAIENLKLLTFNNSPGTKTFKKK